MLVKYYSIPMTLTGNTIVCIPSSYLMLSYLIDNFYNVSLITIKLKYQGNVVSETIKFNIRNDEYKYPRKQIVFMNRLGAYSYFTFIGKTYETTKKDFKTFLKNNTDDKDYNTIYDMNVNSEYIFNSNYINEETFDFMEELFTSPKVYLIDNENVIPITITSNDWNSLKTENYKAIRFSIKAIGSNEKTINI